MHGVVLCGVVESSYSPTHNIGPHISWHDPPCHMTTKKYTDFPNMVIFQLRLRKFWIQTWFGDCQQYLCLFHIIFEYTQVNMIKERCWFSEKSNSLLSTFHIGLIFCFFPAILMSSTYTDKNNPFSRCTNKHSQVETFSQPFFKRIFSNCLSHNSPAKG